MQSQQLNLYRAFFKHLPALSFLTHYHHHHHINTDTLSDMALIPFWIHLPFPHYPFRPLPPFPFYPLCRPPVTYKTPIPTGEVYFAETFDDGSLDRWQVSKTMKDDADEDIAKYDGKWAVEQLKENIVPGDKGLVLKSRAKHHAIAALLAKPFVFEDEPLVLQYEVNFQDGIDCGGAYIKLLSDSPSLNLEQFNDRTPYTIMFGPDKCGEDYKLHFIFRHQNPLNKDLEEKHAKRADVDLKKIYMDKKTHLYTLVLNPDNSYELFIDQSSVSRGSLLHDVVPPVNPPKEIDDPKDSKPEDWDERAKIPDPEAIKPEDWDEEAPAKIQDPDALKPEGWLDEEPEFVSDPSAEKPEDWDEEMDGEWEAPQIPNPACATAPGCGHWKSPTVNNPLYKGKWKAPLVDNPNYQGVWSPKKILNPEFFEDLQPFRMRSFRAVGLELWSMTSDIYFDNFIVTSHKEVADRWAADSWGLKKLVASANEVANPSRTHTHTHMLMHVHAPSCGRDGVFAHYDVYFAFFFFCRKASSVILALSVCVYI
uniref:Calmegin n=1 Tax=Gadus morhua TaxID=8049 RepID=A0A8C5BJM8_GADMO